jgi:hypothetical protein
MVSVYPQTILDPQAWAQQQYGEVAIGDKRRTDRLVRTAAGMMRRPNAFLPSQMGSWDALKGAYRLLGQEDVTYAALMAPHWQQTREAAGQEPLVLMVQDTTEVDHTHHPSIAGLGPIGNGKGRGYLLQTVLAVIPQPRQVLGIAQQEPFLRQPAPAKETRAQRRERPRESQVWSRAAAAVGQPAPGARWVHVGDAYSDIFEFLAACGQQGADFLVRAAYNRTVKTVPDDAKTHLFDFARGLPAQAERVLDLPARDGKPARQARVTLSFGSVNLQAPQLGPRQTPIAAWVVRVWEPTPPAEVDEPLEWVLITSVPADTAEQAWERSDWYSCRWLVEDYHKCLKTGCRVEQRRLDDGAGLFRLLGLLAPIAVHLLQLRELARLEPARLAGDVLPAELVELVALLAGLAPEALTVRQFWREVARHGGYLGRRRDGPPGWQTLWQGWLHIQTLREGVHLAARLTQPA